MNDEENIAWHKLWCSTWLLNNPDVKCEYSDEDDDLHFVNVYIKDKIYSFHSEKKDLFYVKFWEFLESVGANKDNIETT